MRASAVLILGIAAMSQQIPESDWKTLRELKPMLLERFCRRVLADVTQMANNNSETYHERYSRIFRLLQEGDDDLARAFDDIRRSNAIQKLTAIRMLGLLDDEEFVRFRPETRTLIDELVSIHRSRSQPGRRCLEA
jgi:hypothetical protein